MCSIIFCHFPLEYGMNNAWSMTGTQYILVDFNELINHSEKNCSRVVRTCLFFNIEEWNAVIWETSVFELNLLLLNKE